MRHRLILVLGGVDTRRAYALSTAFSLIQMATCDHREVCGKHLYVQIRVKGSPPPKPLSVKVIRHLHVVCRRAAVLLVQHAWPLLSWAHRRSTEPQQSKYDTNTTRCMYALVEPTCYHGRSVFFHVTCPPPLSLRSASPSFPPSPPPPQPPPPRSSPSSLRMSSSLFDVCRAGSHQKTVFRPSCREKKRE